MYLTLIFKFSFFKCSVKVFVSHFFVSSIGGKADVVIFEKKLVI